MEQGRPLRIIDKGQDGYYPNRANINSLKQELTKGDVAKLRVTVISVSGTMRAGKSTLLNFLLRALRWLEGGKCLDDRGWLTSEAELNGFSSRGGLEADTLGVLVWSHPFRIVDPSDGEPRIVLLMDTQGSFDQQSSKLDCAAVFAFSTMFASTQILNVKGNLDENVFDYLAAFTDFGLHARPDFKPYQHLVLLIRDWDHSDAFGFVGGRQLLERRLQEDEAMSHEARQNRRRLKQSLHLVECCLFPSPGQMAACGNWAIEHVDDEFLENLHDFVRNSTLFRDKLLGDRTLNCKELFDHMIALLSVFDQSDMPTLDVLLQVQTTQSSSTSTTESAPSESRFSGEYTKRTEIGRGVFGVVFKAQYKIDERWYAIKQVGPVDAVDVADTKQSPNKVLREVHILAKLDHPHIVRYYDAWLEIPPPGEKLASMMDDNLRYLYIRMELCCDLTLHGWLEQNQLPEQRPVSQTLDWFCQLVSAVKYIHDKGLIHRDINPGNIFFGSSHGGAAPVLKIGDFGLATYAAVSSSSGVSGGVRACLSIVGTSSYMSPEQPSGNYKNSTDIFSLGLVFLEIVHPFKTDMERYAVFGALRSKQRSAVIDELDKKMDTLISWMTAFEPEKRPTASELDNELKREILLRSETNFTDLPRELMLKIFDYLYEGDLAQCALVSRKFRAIANHQILWKSLYQEVFEYSLPLLHVGHARFEFREPHDWPQPRSVSSSVPVQTGTTNAGTNEDDESIVGNPWKESFKQLRNVQALQKDGIHVRPGYAPLYSGFGAGGRRLTQCDRLDQALRLVNARGKSVEKLIFLHSGLHIPETTVTINSDIQIIGASAGPDIASRVIIEGRRTTAVTLARGSQDAYLGWMTVRFAPDSEDVTAAVAAGIPPMHMYHCALQVSPTSSFAEHMLFISTIHGDSTALVEHCIIHSSATDGEAVCVKGRAANPKMRHCVVCDCEGAGIFVTDAAQGQFEDCEIARNNGPGILVEDGANPFFRRCHIHNGCSVGIFTSDNGMGCFESCNIHNNRCAGIEVKNAASPTVTRCEVHHGQMSGVYVHSKFMENRIHSNASAGIEIASHSDPTFQRNEIYDGLKGGVAIYNKGRGLIEENEVYGNTFSGISVTTGSSPIIRKNSIHSGKRAGVYFDDNGRGVLEENDIFSHLHSGLKIGKRSNPKITRNKIRGNQEDGVLVRNNGQGVLEDNEIFDNATAGVWIETDSNPTLRRNKIYDGRGAGVCIFNKGRGVLEGNDIYRNAQTGVIILSESNPTLRRNRVYEGRAAGIEIRRGAMATLESNAIFRNRFGGLCLATGTKPTLRDNKIYDNDDLVEKTIAKGDCLFEITSHTSFLMHDIYHCDTCNMTEKDAICLNCIRTCHGGHTVRLVCHDSFFCFCGAGMLRDQCKRQSEIRDNDSTLSPVGSEQQ